MMSTGNMNYFVKNHNDIVVHVGSKRECRQWARNKNHEHQTDTYRVGEYKEDS